MGCADILLKLLGNLAGDPTNPKYQKIRVTNPMLQERLFAVPGAHALLCALGWQEEGEFMVAHTPDGGVLTDCVVYTAPDVP